MELNVDRKTWWRVSCAAMCRIEHEERYLLLLNRNRRRKGVYVLSPVGGALQFTDLAALEAFDVRLENPAAHELRFAILPLYFPAFRIWFYRREGRERSPWRELYEELVEETALLPTLRPDDVRITFSNTVERTQNTSRQGLTGWLTHYFFEIYDVQCLRADVLGPLLAAPPESGAVWVSEEQIRSARPLSLYFDGAERQVAVNGQILLPPAPKQPRSENSLNSNETV